MTDQPQARAGDAQADKGSEHQGAVESAGAPAARSRPWWLLGLFGLALAAAAGYYFYNEHQKKVLEAQLVSACQRDEREACSVLCVRSPPDYSACFRQAKLLSTGSPDKRNDERATQLFEKVCASGQKDATEACAHLGRAYYNGMGTKRDLPRARTQFESACQKNSPLGCAGLGQMLMLGQAGLPRDPKKSFDLFRRACDAGEPRGCASLAVAHLNGSGTQRDPAKALSIFERACQQGVDRGCLGKGAMLFDAQGVARDEKTAIGLFQRACDGESKEACAYLGMAYLFGRGLERDSKRALTMFTQACEAAPPAGCVVLGEIYASGQSGVGDPKLAEKYYRRGCEYGLPEGCLAVGMATLTGALGIPRDEQKGAALMRDACEKDQSPLACSQLAMLELQGMGPIKKDPASARRRADGACTASYAPACTLVGTLLLQGAEGTPEPAQASRYFEKACQAGDGNGCALQGAQLVNGNGIRRDRERGTTLIKEGCEKMGSPQGCAMYAQLLMMGLEGKEGLAKGAKYAESLCVQGELGSCLLAAGAYLEGRGVDKNMEKGAQILVVACKEGFDTACKLQKRLPREMVEKAEKQANEALERMAAASSARPVPSGLPSFLPRPGP